MLPLARLYPSAVLLRRRAAFDIVLKLTLLPGCRPRTAGGHMCSPLPEAFISSWLMTSVVTGS